MKRILVLGAGQYYCRVLEKLVEAGFYVLAVDKNPDAAGATLAHEFCAIDITDKQGVYQWAHASNIDGILPVNDFGVRSAAYVSERLGLVGITPITAEKANDKGLMRDAWQIARLAQPAYRVIETVAELETALQQIGLPAVLKPTDCGGSGRGISVIRSREELQWAYEFAHPYVHNRRFILEQFMEGIEMTIESLSIDGQVHILAMSDKEKPNLRTRVATSLNFPAKFPQETLQAVRQLVTQAVLVLGIKNGMAHTEVIVTSEGPKLVELGARGGGGHLFHTLIEAVSGINAPVTAARVLCGEKVTLPPFQENGGVYRFFNPPRGILKAVHGVQEARQLPGILDLAIIKQVGEEVGNLENSLQRAGYVVTTGSTRAEAIQRADAVEAMIQFEIESLQNPIPVA